MIGVARTKAGDQVVLSTRDGMAIRFDEDDVRSMGRPAHGVRGIALQEGDEVVGMVVANGIDDPASLLTVCSNGFGKRTLLTEYRSQGRGGKGLIDIKTSDRNGPVVAIAKVTDADEVMLTTTRGILIRTKISDTRPIGRNTQGVRLIRVEDGDSVRSLAKLPEDELTEEEAEALAEAPVPRSMGRVISWMTASPRPRRAITWMIWIGMGSRMPDLFPLRSPSSLRPPPCGGGQGVLQAGGTAPPRVRP